jgi:hypothetical protein
MNMPTSWVDDPTKSIEHLTLGEICRIDGSQFLWTANTHGDSLRPPRNVKDLTFVRWNVMGVRSPVDPAAFFPFRERLRKLTPFEHVPNVNAEWVWDILHVFPHLRCVSIKHGWCFLVEKDRPPFEERTPGGVEELHIFSCNAPLLDIFSQSAYQFQLRTVYLGECRLNSIHELQRLIVASASTLEVLEIRHCMYPSVPHPLNPPYGLTKRLPPRSGATHPMPKPSPHRLRSPRPAMLYSSPAKNLGGNHWTNLPVLDIREVYRRIRVPSPFAR